MRTGSLPPGNTIGIELESPLKMGTTLPPVAITTSGLTPSDLPPQRAPHPYCPWSNAVELDIAAIHPSKFCKFLLESYDKFVLGISGGVRHTIPMRRTRPGCCARAASGQEATPLRKVMNSRRLMLSPRLRTGILPAQTGRLEVIVDVRFGSKADVTFLNFDVRFTPRKRTSLKARFRKLTSWPNRYSLNVASMGQEARTPGLTGDKQ